MLNLTYKEANTFRWWPRRGFDSRLFDLEGTSDDLDSFVSHLKDAAAQGRPLVTEMTEDGHPAWLCVVRSDKDLEFVHLDRGLLVAGNSEWLDEVAVYAGHCVAQGQGESPLHGYHTYVSAYDVHNLSRGRIEAHRPIAELRITWLAQPSGEGNAASDG